MAKTSFSPAKKVLYVHFQTYYLFNNKTNNSNAIAALILSTIREIKKKQPSATFEDHLGIGQVKLFLKFW
jgi:hypothetical protein